MEKKEVINDVIKTFGFTPEQMIEYWLKSEVISKEFLNGLISDTKQAKAETLTFIPSKKFETPKLILPGMFCYADGLIHPELIKNEQIPSVVGSVQGSKILSICLRETELPWSSNVLFLDVENKTSGKEQTQLILEAATREGKKAEAAQYCYEYCEDGVEQGSAFLPSIDELGTFTQVEMIINSSFRELYVSELQGVYWSSSEYDDYYAWGQRFSDGNITNYFSKTNYGYVRPVKEHFI